MVTLQIKARLGRIGMHRMKRNAFGHGVVRVDSKFSKAADYWYFDVTVGTSSLKNHLQNVALDDLDLMTLGLLPCGTQFHPNHMADPEISTTSRH